MFKKIYSLLLILLFVTSCGYNNISETPLYTDSPKVSDISETKRLLQKLPAPERQLVVSVYNYNDLTGQHKPSDTVAEFSRAVTQGGAQLLIEALMSAGSGKWFQVIERASLDNLLQERKIIRATRQEYADVKGGSLPNLPPLLYAGILLEGGIIAYESNVLTGGIGARYLGVGGSTEYRRDVVTVALRATSVSNGQILVSTSASKTIYSTAAQGGVFKYVGVNELLEIESGFSVNEPPQYATRQAIEMAVYSLIMEGIKKGAWSFADNNNQKSVIESYQRVKNGYDNVSDALDSVGNAQPVAEEVKPAPTNQSQPAKSSPTNLAPNNLAPINLGNQNIPRPNLRQLPSNAAPRIAPNNLSSEPNLNRRMRIESYRNRPDNSRNYYRNDVHCDANGCYSATPQSR
jgi:curli production assembly/transport component CsgG